MLAPIKPREPQAAPTGKPARDGEAEPAPTSDAAEPSGDVAAAPATD
jgi:hypothetical protein